MFFSPDRFTRDMADGVVLRRELKRYGVRLFCYYPVPHEISTDMKILNVLTDWQSQQESEKRRAATMRGVNEKIREGLFPQGWAPYGYRISGRKRETVIDIYEEEAEIIRQIYDWYYYHSVGCIEIARRLNDRHIISDPVRSKNSTWSDRRILLILKNEAYAGVWYANTYERISKTQLQRRPKSQHVAITIPAIISRMLWEQVQEKIRTRHTGRTVTYDYLMSCRMLCVCGRHMSGKPKTNGNKYYMYYACNSNRDRNRTCFEKGVVVSQVDDIVWQFAYELLQDPQRILSGYRTMQEESQEEQDTLARQIDALTEQIETHTVELASIVDQASRAKSQALQSVLEQKTEELGTIIDGLGNRREALLERQKDRPFDELAQRELIAEVEALRHSVDALKMIDQDADFEAKRTLIELLNLKATIRTDEQGQRWVDIHWLRTVNPRQLFPQSSQPAKR
jgi:DNA invertase Pin-like site-specific DNA recombinase